MPEYFSYFVPAYEYAPAGLSPEEALTRLREGNARFMAGAMKHERMNAARRVALRQGQSPFVAVICCSDSRVPPEEIFDQGLGEMFVIRTAGHVMDAIALGSLEYAVRFLGTRLVLVLGHEECGAVAAALAEKNAQGHIEAVVEAIRPALRGLGPNAPLNEAVLAQLRYVTRQVKSAGPYLPELIASGQVVVKAALYRFINGQAVFME